MPFEGLQVVPHVAPFAAVTATRQPDSEDLCEAVGERMHGSPPLLGCPSRSRGAIGGLQAPEAWAAGRTRLRRPYSFPPYGDFETSASSAALGVLREVWLFDQTF